MGEREKERERERKRERERERERNALIIGPTMLSRVTGPTRLSSNLNVRYLVDADAFVEAGVVAGVGEVDVA